MRVIPRLIISYEITRGFLERNNSRKNLLAKQRFENYHHALSFGVTHYCNPSNYFAQLFAVCRF